MEYVDWLKEAEAALVEALRVAENEEWHHKAGKTGEAQAYRRLGTLLAAVSKEVRRTKGCQGKLSG